MKINSENIKENNLETVRISPENQDDLWILSNLMVAGDTLSSITTRKLQSNTGKGGAREKLYLTISIDNVVYQKNANLLRVKGKGISGETVAGKVTAKVAGLFHTIEVEAGQAIELRKKRWDSVSVKALLDCCNRTAGADVAVETSSGHHQSLKEFLEMTRVKPAHTCSGPKQVEMAHEWGAIKILLISDHLYRSADEVTRRKYIDMADSVKKEGGNVLVVSPVNVSGEQLDQLAGIAAILRFAIFDIDERIHKRKSSLKKEKRSNLIQYTTI